MEIFYWYRGYGIRYVQWGGTTYVEENGWVIKEFVGYGQYDGRVAAEGYVDLLHELAQEKI